MVAVLSRASRPLIALLRDRDLTIRSAAVKALEEIGAPGIEPLIAALKEPNLAVIAKAYAFFIDEGEPGSEDVLVDALNKFGDKAMAEDYLNCGNTDLKQAAIKWGNAHGYFEGAGDGRPGPWGSK